MIKNFIWQPYNGTNRFPNYVKITDEYTLIGTVSGGYNITLGKLVIGNSLSAGTPLTHVIFESFTGHGERAKVTRTRASGFGSGFRAIQSAMYEAGIDFELSPQSSAIEVLEALGKWFRTENSEIYRTSVVSQTCH